MTGRDQQRTKLHWQKFVVRVYGDPMAEDMLYIYESICSLTSEFVEFEHNNVPLIVQDSLLCPVCGGDSCMSSRTIGSVVVGVLYHNISRVCIRIDRYAGVDESMSSTGRGSVASFMNGEKEEWDCGRREGGRENVLCPALSNDQ